MSSDEEMVQVVVNVPKSTKETAQEKLEYGGLTREVRDTLERVAFGEDLNQRSRFERQLEELQDKREGLRDDRRELDAKIEALDNKINGVQNSLGQLSSEEERYEAKLEEAEYRLRAEGMHAHPENPIIERIASDSRREPEGVVGDLKQRNPDIPDYAFGPVPPSHKRDPFENPKWEGMPDEEDIDLSIDEREAKYR